MNANPRVSVLVVSFNVRHQLAACIESALAGAEEGLEVEVVVVDNASADGSPELVRRRFPKVELVALAENEGFSRAVNRAARLARGELLLLLNPDAELPAGALGCMVASLEAHPEAAAIAVRQVDEAGFFQLAVGPRPTFPAELGRKLVQMRLDRRGRLTAALLDRWLSRPRLVPWAAASCLLVRRSAFERVGGFDEGFFLYFEDIDFCLRLRPAAGGVLYDPSVTVVHRRGASAATARSLARRAYRRSQLRFFEKHRGRWARALVHLYLRLRGEAARDRG